MTLHSPQASSAFKQKPAARDTRAPRAPSIVASFCRLPSPASVVGSVAPDVYPLVLAAARGLPAALREGATSVILGAPPLQMSQQLWGLLSSGPGPSRERCHPVSDGQIHPLDESRVQSSRETQYLQGGFESGLCPEPHHVRDAHQLAPKVSFSSPDRRSSLLTPATDVHGTLADSPGASVQNGP